jgi:hypothetical protein
MDLSPLPTFEQPDRPQYVPFQDPVQWRFKSGDYHTYYYGSDYKAYLISGH